MSRRKSRASRLLHFEHLEPRNMMHAGHDHAEAAAIAQPAAAAAVSPLAVLPDMIPWADQAKGFIYDWGIQGNQLRLTSAAANLGPGPMELRGGATHPDGTQDVYQRIYASDGTFSDVLAGTFTYHPEHGHIHFDGFAQYSLRAVLPDGGVGAVVSAGQKTSFCLLDVERYNTTAPAQYMTCGQLQGISPGWADVYSRGLEGQSIDITNVPDGMYWLEVMVDPENRLVEANENNNVVRLKINLARGSGGGLIPPDAFEANDSFAAASILAPPEDHTYPTLSIHAAGNDDYYRVNVSSTGVMGISLAFQNSQGDVDLYVYNSSQTLVAKSTSSTANTEQVSGNVIAGENYYVRVVGYLGATNPNYSLTIDQAPLAAPILPDAFEPNDSFATASVLAPPDDRTYTNLSIHAPSNDDYYRVTASATGVLGISLAFQNSQGDVDLYLYNSSQALLSQSTSSTANSEVLARNVVAGENIYVRVVGYNGATNPNYSLTVDQPNSTPSATYYVSTSDAGTLANTTGAANTVFSDADILKLVVLSNGQYAYSLFFDGSDVGLTTSAEDIDAFTFLADGSIVISTTGAFSVPSGGGRTLSGNGEDLLRFAPTSLGDNTAGTWSPYFDGSDVGLTGANENLDAVAVLSDGRVLISTTDDFSVTGASGADEDLVAFTPRTLGANTTGTWALYFDGSDVGLADTSAEDINSLYVRQTSGNPTLFFTTVDNFSVTGATGANEDAFAFSPSTLGATTAGTFGPGLAFDGSLYGLGPFDVDGFYIGPAPGTLSAAAQQSAVTTASPVGLQGDSRQAATQPLSAAATGPTASNDESVAPKSRTSLSEILARLMSTVTQRGRGALAKNAVKTAPDPSAYDKTLLPPLAKSLTSVLRTRV